MSERTVTTQAELDQALADKVDWIDIRSPKGVWLTVTAYGSATVTAYGSATVTAYGSATVTAGTYTAVHLHSAKVHVTGGVIIDHSKVDLTDAKAWCDYHGVEVKRGIATVYKAVNDDWTSPHGANYAPGTKPSCDDWIDADTCGNGLHFGPTPSHALAYHPDAVRFLQVGIKLTELRPITDGGTAKCKAPKVSRACVEVDVYGRIVETAA